MLKMGLAVLTCFMSPNWFITLGASEVWYSFMMFFGRSPKFKSLRYINQTIYEHT